MSPIIGIDLGTTYSAVGFVREGRPLILPNGAEAITPSVVGFTPSNTLVVGTPARNQYALYPENTVRSIKRKMGTAETVTLNGRAYTPVEISAIILKEMKRVAEANLGEAVTRAVITVPAYFSDAARQATKEAGEVAGFTVERILNEPTAAALAYGLDRVTDTQMIAVYDLGGGTFDVSIIELNQGVLEVRASHGDTSLGGDDFDELMVAWLAERFRAEYGVDPRNDRKAHARLLRAAEAAKITLSTQPFARLREEYLLEKDGHALHLQDEISRVEFEKLIAELLQGTLTAFDEALADAGLSASDLDKVLFVGGSTRIPLVWEMVARHTGLEPMVEINPDEAVALGAGVQAALIAGEPLDAILVDVTPHSLGIEVAELRLGRIIPDHYGIIIRRNTTLPTTKAQAFNAVHSGQTAIQVKVYQGEAPVASQNTLLGEFMFEDLKPEIPGQPPQIMVEFDLDVNGILKVEATDRGSQQVRQTVLHAAHTRLSPNDKAASARYIEQVWEKSMSDLELTEDEVWGEESLGSLENALGAADETDSLDDPILVRARALLGAQVDALAPLADLVRRLEMAKREGRTEAAEELRDQITDILYDLDEGEEE